MAKIPPVSLSDWKTNARAQQDNFCNQLGDRIWDAFEHPQHGNLLFKKIALPLFGAPKPDRDDLGLTTEQIELVTEIQKKCYEHGSWADKVYVGVIFVGVYLNDAIQTWVPVYRIRKLKNGDDVKNVKMSAFIDHLGRVYESWENYKDDNMWNKSYICAPGSGYYDCQYSDDIYFHDQSGRGEWLEVADTASTITGIGSSVGMVVGLGLSFFPPTAPIGLATMSISAAVGAPGAAYGAGRSVTGLIDRAKHDQSISLGDSTARMQWLTTVTSIISVGTMASAQILSSTARAGNIASGTTRALCTTLNVTAVSVSGLGVLNSIYEVSQKKEVTALDIFQLTTSVFFFTHSVVSFKTASTIIKEAQRQEINTMRNNIESENQPKHDALLQGHKETVEMGKVREMHGNAKFIKEMKNIQNVNEFYQHFQLRTDGQLNINNELNIHPRAFLQMSETDRNQILTLSRQLEQNQIDLKTFNQQAAPIQKQYRLRLERHRADAQTYLNNKMGDTIGNQRISDLPPHQIDRLENVVKNSLKGDQDLINIADKVATKQGANGVTEYCAVGEYAARQIEAEIKLRRAENPNPPRNGGKAREFYKQQIISEWLADDAKLTSISDDFTSLRSRCDASNVGTPRYGNSMAAANHYDKHPFFPDVDPHNNLTPEAYFDIASEMCQDDNISEMRWTQEGTSLKCTFTSEKYGAVAIAFQNLQDKKTVIATCMSTNETRMYQQ